jgi:hypothetical protein
MLVKRKPEMTVWAAIIKGLDDCQQSDAPLAALGEFLQKLHAKGWQIADVQLIEQWILKLLSSKREQRLCRPNTHVRCSD